MLRLWLRLSLRPLLPASPPPCHAHRKGETSLVLALAAVSLSGLRLLFHFTSIHPNQHPCPFIPQLPSSPSFSPQP
ncbi:hypothetical protein E2C01_088300 [Portunus trituberculatus]|uniref:Uncharacterized protein n=1 Tax=Portunus trituberculatus TaxID=210409 RepID=A0A5B7JJH0_PORTR|nr:hypothetical protein [Portunus trituberculatus]